MSPHVMEYRGRFVYAAMVSAVEVFPDPGGPCNRIIKPCPFPLTMSIWAGFSEALAFLLFSIPRWSPEA